MLWALIAAVAGTSGTIAVAFADPSIAMQGWLAAAFASSAVPIGALGLLLLHAMVGGPWKRPLAPVLYASARTLPVFALAFVPVIALPSLVYPWAAPGAENDPVLAAKAAYLQPTFFALRTIIYFAIWIVLTGLISNEGGTEDDRPRARLVPAVGLVLFAVTVSFAAVDWAMSVDPGFSSSAFGLLVGIADLLAALTFAVALTAWFGSPNMRAAADNGRVRAAISGMLAGGVLLWAYVSFMQYLVVWSEDLPEQASWYLDRGAGGWRIVPWMLVVLLGALPVTALALPAGRRSVDRIAAIALLIFGMRLVEALWLVLPSFPLRSWLQPVAWLSASLALAGIGFAAVLSLWAREYRREPRPGVVQHG
jgi:hypothetical protein